MDDMLDEFEASSAVELSMAACVVASFVLGLNWAGSIKNVPMAENLVEVGNLSLLVEPCM